MNDEYYMNIAMKEAKKAANIDEVPVGDIFVYKYNIIIGFGYNSPI
jgi:tRNA(adenine34) deaminase